MSAGTGTRTGEGLGHRAVHGAAVTVAGQLGRVVIQMLSVVVLARLLTPSDYGLFAMVMSVAGIAEVFRDFGLSQAAVQAKTLSDGQRSMLFWANSLFGFVLALAVFAGSWPIAAFFGHPELVPLAHVVAVVFLLNGFATQYRAGLTRSLRFTALAAIDLASALLALGTAIAFGVAGAGVWALVAQLVMQSLVVLVGTAAMDRWVPARPRRGTAIRPFLRFGWHMVATQIVTYIGNNADTVTIGLRLGAAPLGIYNRPYQLVTTVANQMRSPISNVAIPVLSRLQDAGSRYWELARVGQLAFGYTIVVILAVVAGAGVPLTNILLGHKWIDSAPVLSLLAASAAIQALGYFGYWVYVSKGVTGALFSYNLVSVAIKVVFLVVGSFWGVTGVAAGYFLSTLVTWPISLAWIARTVRGVPIRVYTLGFIRLGSIGAVAAGAAYLTTICTRPDGSWVQLFAAVGGVGCAYGLALVLPAVRRDVRDLRSAAVKLRRRRIRTGSTG